MNNSLRLLTLFVDCIPCDTAMFIWDTMLYEGDKVWVSESLNVTLILFRLCSATHLRS